MNKVIDNNLIEISYKFALKIVKLTTDIQNKNKEYVLSKSLLRTGTSVGALLTEVNYLDDREEQITKLKYALSDVFKTKYWLTLLLSSNYVEQTQFNNLIADLKKIYTYLQKELETIKQN